MAEKETTVKAEAALEPAVTSAAEKKGETGAKKEEKAAAKKETKTTAKKTAAKKTSTVAAKKTGTKKAEEKAAAEKAETAKAVKAEAKAAAEEKGKAVTPVVHLQFGGKSYSMEDLHKIANDVWKYDLHNEEEYTSLELYVKPEDKVAYYVFNGEITGSFFI